MRLEAFISAVQQSEREDELDVGSKSGLSDAVRMEVELIVLDLVKRLQERRVSLAQ